MKVGDIVICTDDKFNFDDGRGFTALPVVGESYKIRKVTIEGYALEGINGVLFFPGGGEKVFKRARFRPLA